MKPQRPQFYDRGTPGNYRLNQHADRFGDKRTKRSRDRSAVKRQAITKSKDDQ